MLVQVCVGDLLFNDKKTLGHFTVELNIKCLGILGYIKITNHGVVIKEGVIALTSLYMQHLSWKGASPSLVVSEMKMGSGVVKTAARGAGFRQVLYLF